MRPGLLVGHRRQARHRVTSALTVPAVLPRSSLARGEPVLASAMLIALGEALCWDAMRPFVEDSETLLGWGFDFAHVAPAGLGAEVTLTAECLSAHCGDVTWVVSAAHECTGVDVGTLRHRLRVVDRQRFRSKVCPVAV